MLAISEQVTAALKETLPDLSRSIAAGSPGGKPALPFIFVYCPEFTFADSGFGGGGAFTSEEVSDELEGNGRKTTFRLSKTAQRPLSSVESPRGRRLTEYSDFDVDYSAGTVSLKTPPAKGVAVVLRYLSAASASRTRSVRLNVVCNVDVWGADERSVDAMVLDVIRGIVLSQETLSAKGIRIAPSRGVTLGPDDGLPERVYAQRIVYAAETDIEAKERVPRIEGIRVEQKPPR